MQPWWLDSVCGKDGWTAAIIHDSNDHIIASLPFRKGSELGLLQWARMPKLTPYTGLLIKYPNNMTSASAREYYIGRCWSEVHQKLPLGYLNLVLHPGLSPVLPWASFDLRSSSQVTYTLPLHQDVDTLWNLAKPSVRGKIRKAEKQLDIIYPDHCADLYQMLDKSFTKQNLKVPFSLDFLTQLYQSLSQHGQCILTIAIDGQGRLHAGNLVIIDEKYAYNLITGSDSELHQSGAVPFLIWNAIKSLQGKVDYFDFEGGMIPRIASLYRSFGAIRTPCTRIYRSANKMTDAFFTLIGRF